MEGRIASGRCSGTSEARYHRSAEELLESEPPAQWMDRVRRAAYSNRFVVVWRDPLIAVYLGENGDYVIVEGYYCSCPGFTMRTTRKGIMGCTHVYAFRIALREGRYRDISGSLSPGEVVSIVWEALTGPYAYSVRRLLALADEVGYDHDDGEDG
ncbi:MAG: hypothetical protein F7C82_01280 [Desulfurococcales archaeon]|nr:hypothetical protein [Desulfurococcales archaeon]MCE4621795.1 hypothetical protein [Desulfurococcales archaeon]MCE4628893.1 hypothetical protein [Desulfurococcales archaeon]